ncbi:FAD-dependent oxidoreductase [Macrococcoides canis]|uniref:FAD-dependent oxidoreductase n=1 Tax=Macrococcoides canis TaxID=1855823 RepID=UPI0020B78647|nr:FAD-dependent oxidoreductase [Macrococcus canis]UTG99684.1 FAD-dependent oxidoreductase [Macrococcus canis]WBF53323.1 FAD-dependent oxidoreductase [Macrococcus canis]
MKNEHISYWSQSAEVIKVAPLDKSMQTEILIIGAGMAGILNAYELNKRGHKVTVVDAHELAQLTSAHTTAKLTLQHFTPYQMLLKNIGETGAKLYHESQLDGIEIYRQLIEKYNIQCDYEPMSNYIVSNGDKEKFIEDEYKAHQTIGIHSELHKGDQGLPFPTSIGLEIKEQAQFNPVKFMAQMIEICIEEGVTFYQSTPVKYIEGNIAYTAQHEITFDHVVMASQYPVQTDGERRYALQAERAYIITASGYDTFKYGMFQYMDDPMMSIRHFHTQNGEALILAGGNHLTGAANDPKASYEALEDQARKYFNAKDITGRWSAQDLNTPDTVPYIGRYNKRDNVWVISGFNKFGMLFSAVSSHIISDLLEGKDNKYEAILDPERDHGLKANIMSKANKGVQLVKGEILSLNEFESVNDKTKDAVIYNDNGSLKGVINTTASREVVPFCTYCDSLLKYNNAEESWDCPSDGSRFDQFGEVLHGPAVEKLK